MGGGLQALLVFALVVVVITCGFLVWFVLNAVSYFENGNAIDREKIKKRFYKSWLLVLVPSVIIALLSMLLR